MNSWFNYVTLIAVSLLILSCAPTKRYAGPLKPETEIAKLSCAPLYLLSIDGKSCGHSTRLDHYDLLPGVHSLKLDCLIDLKEKQYQSKTPFTISYTFETGRSYQTKFYYTIKDSQLDKWRVWIVDTESVNQQRRLILDSLDQNMILVSGGTLHQNNISSDDLQIAPYLIGKTEVTQALWEAVMGDIIVASKQGEDYPVTYISWYDAVDFCNKLSLLSGLTPYYAGKDDKITCNLGANGYRLLTKAEWEYAATGGKLSHGFRYSGSSDYDAVAWTLENSANQIHPVMSKSANELGIYDLSGNAAEWIWNPVLIKGKAKPFRVTQGGSWFDKATDCTLKSWFYSKPGESYSTVGFRICRNAD